MGIIGDPRAKAPLLRLLEDETAEVRSGAAEGLGHLKDKDTVEPLIKALKDKDTTVRTSVVRALGAIGDPRVINPLRDLLTTEEDSDVKDVINEALKIVEGEHSAPTREEWTK